MSGVEVRQATEEDIEGLVRLYEATRQWLAQIGSDQWSRNTVERTRERIGYSVRHGECYVAVSGGALLGMVTVDGFADPEFWDQGDKPNNALYVHRMVVDRSASGRNVGALLLDWAENLAAARGKDWLRLDAWKTNTRLHAYYERQGFELVRIVDLSHRGSGALFERRVRSHEQESNRS